jgi:hypothetical protein
MIADGLLVGPLEGACVVGGEVVLVGGGAAVGSVVVTGLVGTTAPVGPTDTWGTKSTADATMPTPKRVMVPSPITAGTTLKQDICRGSWILPEAL